jgi:hypothetical protein
MRTGTAKGGFDRAIRNRCQIPLENFQVRESSVDAADIPFSAALGTQSPWLQGLCHTGTRAHGDVVVFEGSPRILADVTVGVRTAVYIFDPLDSRPTIPSPLFRFPAACDLASAPTHDI